MKRPRNSYQKTTSTDFRGCRLHFTLFLPTTFQTQFVSVFSHNKCLKNVFSLYEDGSQISYIPRKRRWDESWSWLSHWNHTLLWSHSCFEQFDPDFNLGSNDLIIWYWLLLHFSFLKRMMNLERKLELVIEQLQRISQGDPVRIVCKAFCSMFTRASLHLLETLGRNSSARCIRPRKTHN